MKTHRKLTGALVVALFAIGCAGDAASPNGQSLNREFKIENSGERITLSVPAMT